MVMPAEQDLGYADVAQVYWDKGWRGILPLKRGTKWPPPKGFTGYAGADPSFADILQWGELYPDGNVCLRLPNNDETAVVGIDVDAYGVKTGAAAFAEAVRRWGSLPDGPQSSSRDADLVSGLRLFRVPSGTLLEDVIVFPELSIGDIEVIQRHHRYVVCWPSIHPEGRGYWWRNSKGQLLSIPEFDEIPDLPLRWLDGLKLTPRSLEFSGEDFDTRKALTDGEPSPVVSARMVQAIKELNLPGMSRHDTCCRHVLAILRYGREGQSGVEQALMQLRQVFVAVVGMDNSRSPDVATDEFNRMVTNKNVARELAQPGILDWFKRIMDGAKMLDSPSDWTEIVGGGDPDAQDANANRADNVGAAAPGLDAASAATEPPDPNRGGRLEVLEQDFWTARPQHELIFTAALSRMASPWATFACCTARALALVPPSIMLPPLVGGRGSLNWFAAITAKSAGGKGSAMAVARELVPGSIITKKIGSGEGMIECYNRAPGKGDDPPPPVISVMFDVPEIDTLTAMSNRSGSTTMPILRSGFSGEELALSYRGRQSEAVAEHTYRMTLIASVQPSRAGSLFDDAGGGTPQRFMWFPGRDRRVTDDERFSWPTDSLGLELTLSTNMPSNWDMVNAAGVVAIPDEARKEVRRDRAVKNSGSADDDGNDLDGHAFFIREKVAFALAVLDQRLEIDLEDWRLAAIVMAVSNWNRGKVIEAVQESRENESRDRGKLRGVEAAAAELGKMQERTDSVQRVMNNVVDKIKRAMPDGISNRDLTQRITSRDRGLLKGALDYLLGQGTIIQREGTTIWVTR